jgi:hypothetical protein
MRVILAGALSGLCRRRAVARQNAAMDSTCIRQGRMLNLLPSLSRRRGCCSGSLFRARLPCACGAAAYAIHGRHADFNPVMNVCFFD